MIDHNDYDPSFFGFKDYLHDLADECFPFPGYRKYQDEILYETLEAFYLEDYENVIIEGPTGIGKSPVNVAVARVNAILYREQRRISDYFGITISGVNNGKSFYTTPQKQLRNQLANDADLREFVSMLKGRVDYACAVGGGNCQDCPVRSSPDESCREQGEDCGYWWAKEQAMAHDIAVTTFAMIIVDNYVPPTTEQGEKISFGNRDLIIVDEGHNAEGQSASLFAGFTLSPWTLPEEVFGDAGDRVNWGASRFEDVEDILRDLQQRAGEFVRKHEEDPQRQSQVESVENVQRKIEYCVKSANEGRGWVTNIDEVAWASSSGTTKKIEMKPVRVNDFLHDFVWSRGRRRLVTSATIPFRGNIQKWAKRIGLGENTKFVSKPTPFPEEHRLVHLNTVVGPMTSEGEEENWDEAMKNILEIHSHHEGEKGLIHSVSYSRAEEVGDALGDNCMVHQPDLDQDAVITAWQNSDKDILVSPTMMQGTDLHGDMCRWQVLLKVPFAYAGDNRVSYLLNEMYEWDWYFEEAAMNIIQSVGRAVRGPEPSEAASFYVIDSKFDDVMHKVTPPEYFGSAVRDDPPEHWDNPEAAPWR